MTTISLDRLTKRFGAVSAVDDVSLQVETGGGDGVPRTERRRQDDDHARGARAGSSDLRAGPGRRSPLRRPGLPAVARWVPSSGRTGSTPDGPAGSTCA